MWTEKDIAWAVLYVCLVILAPVTYRFSRVLFRYVFNRYISRADIIVTYARGGVVTSRYKIRRYSDGRVSCSPLGVPGPEAENDR